MKTPGQFTAAVPAATFAVCLLLFGPTVFAQPVSESLGELLVGKAAFGDWRSDAPLVRRKITELPPPNATRSASNFPRVIAKPASATPKVPPGFQVEPFVANLHDPRTIWVAPNGDIFIAESEPGRIRVLRATDGAATPNSNDFLVFVSLRPAILDGDGAALDPAEFAKPLHENGGPMAPTRRRAGAQESDRR